MRDNLGRSWIVKNRSSFDIRDLKLPKAYGCLSVTISMSAHLATRARSWGPKTLDMPREAEAFILDPPDKIIVCYTLASGNQSVRPDRANHNISELSVFNGA